MLHKIINGDKDSQDNPIFRWGMLVFIIILILLSIYMALTMKNNKWIDAAPRIAVPIFLLISHLEGHFRWSQRVRKFLKILSVTWLIILFAVLFLAVQEDNRRTAHERALDYEDRPANASSVRD
jgi:hypothetical protein